MVVYAGQGDPARTMALLWRPAVADVTAAGPGPKRGISVDAIVTAAIDIADAAGIEQLSMRAVGERLGTSAMALYTYVPSKRELVDLMYDQAHASATRSYGIGGGWRAGVAQWVDDVWATYLAHPWLLQVSYARPVLGPHEQQVLESLLRNLMPLGLQRAQLPGVVTSLFNLVRGAAATVAEARAALAVTGTSDPDWWSARAGTLTEVAPDFAERFPLSVAFGASQAAPEPGVPYAESLAQRNLMTGLSLLLDGVESALAA